jgi:hypothetical protein
LGAGTLEGRTTPDGAGVRQRLWRHTVLDHRLR